MKKDLYSISQGNHDIAAYFTEIKKLWDQQDSMLSVPTCPCRTSFTTYIYYQKMREKEQLIQLLVGLNDVYKGVRGNILMTKPLPNVSEAYYMLLQEEHQREMTSKVHIMPHSAAMNSSFNAHQESMGLASNNVNCSRGKNGNNSLSNNNLAANSNITTRRQQSFCDHCKISGHTVQRCYKLHGYPPGHK